MMLNDLLPEEAQRLSALLDEAFELRPEALQAWRNGLVRRDPRLGPLALQLLQYLDRESVVPELEPGLAGHSFGPYRVLGLLGQGGMGSVWLAERADGLFERRVALKLVHRHLSDRAARERFARERQILAQLEHPLIARLLDAGVTQDGQPYLALEYVEGEWLTTHCDARQLSVQARLGLLMQVLTAVEHAHRCLVLHRDLKPANILVTAEGQVRLVDFGIAKLLTEGLVHETELTQQAGRALTPEFASPEQIAGEPLSTASDVYAIGVVMYTLLCGQRPYRVARDSRGALEEAILSSPALRPSQLQLTDAVAQARSTTARKLSRVLSSDLERIVLKAIKKDPAERYPSAEAFRLDLGRYLAGEPVQARPDGLAYRVSKFVRRNRLRVAVGACMAQLLLLASGWSIWQGREAERHAAIAERETLRARSVQSFLQDIFKANSDRQPDPTRARQTTARELLDVGAARLEHNLQDVPLVRIEVLQTLADMYTQLGLNDEAARLRAMRIGLLKREPERDDLALADATLSYVDDIALTNQRALARPALQHAEQLLDQMRDHSSERRGHLWSSAADAAQYFSLFEMRRYADRALAHFRKYPASWNDLQTALVVSAHAYQLSGAYAAAEADNRAALDEAARHAPASTWEVLPLIQLSEALAARQRFEDAEQHMRRALAQSSRINGPEFCYSLQARAKLGGLLHTLGRRSEGMQLIDEAQAVITRQQASATADSSAVTRSERAWALLREGRAQDAERAFADEIAYRETYFPASIPLAWALLGQAGALRLLGWQDQSEAALAEAVRLWEAASGGSARPELDNAYLLEQARGRLARGDAAGARARLSALVRAPEPLLLRPDEVQTQLILAQASMLEADWAGAEVLAREALALVQSSTLRASFPRLEAEAELRLGQALAHGADAREAQPVLAHALALRERTDDPSSPLLAEIRHALQR